MVLDAQELADALAEEPESMYVRLAARWLTHGDPASPAPALTRNRVADALVAATVALKAQRESVPTPAWTNEPERRSIACGTPARHSSSGGRWHMPPLS